MKQITITLTGDPGAGKSLLLKFIRAYLTDNNFAVGEIENHTLVVDVSPEDREFLGGIR